jgi:ABC-type lipoprotein export system ATPase subunit
MTYEQNRVKITQEKPEKTQAKPGKTQQNPAKPDQERPSATLEAAAIHPLTTPRLELRHVTKTYQSAGQPITALDDVSLSFEPGTVTALLGRSGCGKTTLLNMAGAMDFPTSGDVLIDGRSTSSLDDSALTALRRTQIGFVFQFFQLLPTLTVLENVELPLLLAGARNTAAARERLDWVGLASRAAALPHQLSGGQQQRVAIARALVHRPSILVADEPTGNLDTASGDAVLKLIRQSAQEFGATVVMATHSAEAAAIADACVRLRDGRVES